jgi:hypothetical protein
MRVCCLHDGMGGGVPVCFYACLFRFCVHCGVCICVHVYVHMHTHIRTCVCLCVYPSLCTGDGNELTYVSCTQKALGLLA